MPGSVRQSTALAGDRPTRSDLALGGMADMARKMGMEDRVFVHGL